MGLPVATLTAASAATGPALCLVRCVGPAQPSDWHSVLRWSVVHRPATGNSCKFDVAPFAHNDTVVGLVLQEQA